MPSLKEVKTRIASVNSTRKITSAMKMVASSKLHHAQQTIERMRPYESKLSSIMSTFIGGLEGELSSPYAAERKVERIALLVFTSNSSLCGGFNANVIKQMRQQIDSYRTRGIEIARIYPVGKKAAEAVRKLGFSMTQDYSDLLDHPRYAPVAALSSHIMEKFAQGEFDKVEMIYHHFKSAGSQQLTTASFLPLQLHGNTETETERSMIVEPSAETLIENLIPQALHLKLFSVLLDSLASEHAARVIAMQVATDNADELLRELTLQYNKTRQQAITAELLDIVGGSMQ